MRSREASSGKQWQELTVEFLRYHRQAVFFFSPSAWAYYLPAYMMAALRHYREVDTLPNELVATVTPSSEAANSGLVRARLTALTEEQLAVLAVFVNWMATEYPDDIEPEVCEAVIDEIEHIGRHG